VSNDFTTEALLKAGRAVPDPSGDFSYRTQWDKLVPGGATAHEYVDPKTGRNRADWTLKSPNGDVSKLPDGGIHSSSTDKSNNETTFFATTKNPVVTTRHPDGSSEKVRSFGSGHEGKVTNDSVHTRKDPKGQLTSRFHTSQGTSVQTNNGKTTGNKTDAYGGKVDVRGYHSPTPDSGGDLTGGSPAAGGRYQVSTARQSRVATASGTPAPSSTGGEVGAKDDHPFHGNQFTAHGTEVAVVGPKPKVKSFTIDALLQGQGFYRQSGF